MAIMYKLVTQEYTSYGEMKWEIGKTNKAIDEGNEMCTSGVLHCYRNPHLAVILNPAHADIPNPRLLEIECSEIVTQDGLKYACKEQTPLREVEIPQISLMQKVAFGIKCAMAVCHDEDWNAWANDWLTGVDRTADAAAAAAAYADAAAADHAAYAAADHAAYADAAAYAARAAAYAAAYVADHAAYAAAAAAARAAAAAAYAAIPTVISFEEILQWVLENIN